MEAKSYIAFDDINKKTIIEWEGNSYDLGYLLLEFLELDLTEFEVEREKIKAVIDNNDIESMENVISNFRKSKNFSRGLTPYIYRHLKLEGLLKEDKYVVYSLYKAFSKIDHPYLYAIDHTKMRKLHHSELLEIFNLFAIQNEYKEAVNYCLLKSKDVIDPIKLFKDYNRPLKGKAEVLFKVSEKMTLNEVFIASDITSLLYVEFMKMIQYSVFVRKCENCGKYFILKGNYDAKYCDRIPDGENKSCQEIGAVKKFKSKILDNPIYGEYEKVYKRFHARKRKGLVTSEQFGEWSKSSAILRDKAIKGEISFEEYKEELIKI